MPATSPDSQSLPLLPAEACPAKRDSQGPGRLMAMRPEAAPSLPERPRALDAATVRSIPEHIAQRHLCLPLVVRQNLLVLGMADPLKIVAIDDIRLITGFDIETVPLPESAIRAAITTGDCDGIFSALEDQGRQDVLEELYEAARRTHGPRPATPRERVDPESPFPLRAIDVQARISGPLASVRVAQRFANPHASPIEALYIFPLPEGAAIHAFRMRVADRVVEGEIRERGAARATYEKGKAQGHRAALIEQDRDNVFTVQVGNLPPGEEVTIEVEYAERLESNESETSFRFPLVVAPRYIPGAPMDGLSQGAGCAPDTHRVPDASRITPPLLLPDLKAGATLDLVVTLETAGLLPCFLACSQHAVSQAAAHGALQIRLARTDEMLDRDFVLRFRVAESQPLATLLTWDPPTSPGVDAVPGYFLLSVLPPLALEAGRGHVPRDVIFLLDRSGSMQGAKMTCARRAVARFLETLRTGDRFALVAFDDVQEVFAVHAHDADNAPLTLLPVTQRNVARHWLDLIDARGGTEILQPILRVLATPAQEGRLLCAVILTDGEVGNEPEIHRIVRQSATPVRLFTLGIDTAVNSAFLRELARLGRGTCELVTPGEALEDALTRLARETEATVVTGLSLVDRGLGPVDDTLAPDPLPDLFAARPVHVMGRKRGTGGLEVRGLLPPPGGTWISTLVPVPSDNPALGILWARGRVQVLEDRIRLEPDRKAEWEREIVALALRHGLLTRLTSFVLVDRSEVVNPSAEEHTVVQPVSLPAQWEATSPAPFGGFGISDLAEVEETVKDISAQDFGPLDTVDTEEEIALDKLKEMVDEAPIIRVVNLIISQAVNDGASHAHIEPQARGVTVRYRVGGVLRDVMNPPRHIHEAMVARLKLMASMDVAVRTRPSTGVFRLRHDSREYRVEVSCCPTQHGERIVLALAPLAGAGAPLLAEVFTVPHVLASVEAILRAPRGIILVAADHRSDVSRTLQALAGSLTAGGRPVMTLDDRVAYEETGAFVARREPGMTEREAVESLFRQDADAVCVGSVTDTDVARFLARQTFRPSLVLVRCEAPDATTALAGWMRRVGDPGLVADTVAGVLAQRSLRRLCPSCRECFSPPSQVARLYRPPATLQRARGCDNCHMEGYSGTVEAFCVVPVSDSLRDVIEGNPGRRALASALSAQATCSIVDDARRLVADGETSHEECERALGDLVPPPSAAP